MSCEFFAEQRLICRGPESFGSVEPMAKSEKPGTAAEYVPMTERDGVAERHIKEAAAQRTDDEALAKYEGEFSAEASTDGSGAQPTKELSEDQVNGLKKLGYVTLAIVGGLFLAFKQIRQWLYNRELKKIQEEKAAKAQMEADAAAEGA